jgi:glycopeptide antibiotics resistance protein
MKMKRKFDLLIKISLILYMLVLVFVVMLKSIIPNDLIANYNFLSTMTLKMRLIRGLKILEFYKIEYEIGVISKTIILDVLNIIIFIPFGILITNYFKTKRLLKTVLVSFVFSVIIEVFQLISIIGAFMLNDIIINCLGGLTGSLIYVLVIGKEKYKLYNILLIIFSTIMVLLLLYLSFNFMNNINIYLNILLRRLH